MFTKKYRRRLGVGCGLQLLNQFCGINAVTFYSSVIFGHITSNQTLITTLTVGCGVIGFSAGILSGLLTRYIGRKPIIMVGTVLSGLISMIVLANLSNGNIVNL